MTRGFEVGAFAPLRALHRLPWMTGPEGELHEHDYRIEVVVERGELDERGMVCDLDLLTAALAEVLGRLEGRDLDEIKPKEAEAVTVEILARWLHGELRGPIAQAGGESLHVRVWEAPDAFGGYAGPVS
jgi:6-pyruvoyltetrahydropterin/6-carboxytetrahydropterin synthase